MNQANVLTCLIIDDEPPAREIVKTYLKAVPSLVLLGEYSNALEAFQRLQHDHIDVLFLDIQMPQLRGTDLIKAIKNPPKVIFTTAFKDYAVEGFDLNAVDYLLKPFSLERFLRAVDKLDFDKTNATPASENQDFQSAESPTKDRADYLYFKVNRKMVKVFLDEILFIESLRDYVKIVTETGQLVTKHPISSVEEMLPERYFQRIHRSFMVSLDKIRSYDAMHVEVGKHELPIGKLYKHEVEKVLARNILARQQ